MNYTKEQLLELKRKKLLLLKARYDLKSFVKLHFEIHKGAEFFENWHIDYLCKILESTLPTRLNSAPAQENGSLGNHLADYANFGAVITDQVTPTPKLAQSYQSNTASVAKATDPYLHMTNFVVGNGNLSQSTPSQEASQAQDSEANLESTQIQDSKKCAMQTQEPISATGIEMSFGGCGARSEGVTLAVMTEAKREHSAKNRSIPTQVGGML